MVSLGGRSFERKTRGFESRHPLSDVQSSNGKINRQAHMDQGY